MVPVDFALFPILAIAGGNWVPNPRWEKRAMQLSANRSYPIYILHWPVLLWVRRVYERTHVPYSAHLHLYGLAEVTIAIGLFWAALKLYDEPIRARLKPLRAAS